MSRQTSVGILSSRLDLHRGLSPALTLSLSRTALGPTCLRRPHNLPETLDLKPPSARPPSSGPPLTRLRACRSECRLPDVRRRRRRVDMLRMRGATTLTRRSICGDSPSSARQGNPRPQAMIPATPPTNPSRAILIIYRIPTTAITTRMILIIATLIRTEGTPRASTANIAIRAITPNMTAMTISLRRSIASSPPTSRLNMRRHFGHLTPWRSQTRLPVRRPLRSPPMPSQSLLQPRALRIRNSALDGFESRVSCWRERLALQPQAGSGPRRLAIEAWTTRITSARESWAILSWKETRLDGELCLRTPRETASLTPFFSHLDSWYYNYSASTSSSAHGAPNRFSNSTMASSLLDPFNNPSFVLHPQTSRTSSQPVASSSSQTGSTPYDADAEHDAEHYRLSLGSSSSSDLSKMFPDIPPELLTFVGDEESSTPRMAPDCSACGIRLDYMRYTCLKVGFQSRQVSRTLKLTYFFLSQTTVRRVRWQTRPFHHYSRGSWSFTLWSASPPP